MGARLFGEAQAAILRAAFPEEYGLAATEQI
jgi:hypothetical protein